MVYYASYASYSKISLGWVISLSMTELAIGVEMLKQFNQETQLIKLDKFRLWSRITVLCLVAIDFITILTFTFYYNEDFATIDSQDQGNQGSSSVKRIYGIVTFAYFTAATLGLTISFIFLSKTLSANSLSSQLLRRTKRQFDFVFGTSMLCFLLWCVFHLLLFFDWFVTFAKSIQPYTIWCV